ncbi:MAG: LamG-like jellyroll fold domain-containing protein [Verrucomicrobiota bacterium]
MAYQLSDLHSFLGRKTRALLCMSGLVTGLCQSAPGQNDAPAVPPNHVLELDGDGDYVELPPDIFKRLDKATVEVWAKWDAFQSYSRVFEFGANMQSMSLLNQGETPTLRFNLYPENMQPVASNLRPQVRAENLLKPGEWIHLAVVSGLGGMKLYANVVLASERADKASFADI